MSTEPEMAQHVLNWAKGFVKRAKKEVDSLDRQLNEQAIQLRIANAVEKERSSWDDTISGFGPPSESNLIEGALENLRASQRTAIRILESNQEFQTFIEKVMAPYINPST